MTKAQKTYASWLRHLALLTVTLTAFTVVCFNYGEADPFHPTDTPASELKR